MNLSLNLLEFNREKVLILRLLKNVKTFVNTTSMKSCFGMPTFYVGFCYHQLNPCDSQQSYKAAPFKIKSEVLLIWTLS